MTVIIHSGSDAGAENQRGDQAENDVEDVYHVRYRTSITLRTTSFAAPGRFCTRVSTSLNACDSPPCLKHSPQRGSCEKSRFSNIACIALSRSPSMTSVSDCVFKSPMT